MTDQTKEPSDKVQRQLVVFLRSCKSLQKETAAAKEQRESRCDGK